MVAVLQYAVENWAIIAGVVLAVLEFWLGKTTKTKSGSTLELLLRIMRVIRDNRKQDGPKS